MAGPKRIKSVNYNKKPFWFSAINSIWKNSYPLGTQIRLDKDILIKEARESTGLKDLGKHFWDEPLERLLYSINTEARLHPIGRFITKKRLINLLDVRLRAEDWFKKHPEILEQELYPVMMIIGLQRTGTTKLHRMLASDPNTRALLSWEALNPVPLNGDMSTGEERIQIAKTSEKALKIISPGFFAIHPVEHLAPEEDVLLLDVSFLSTTAEATMHVPSYSEWLHKTDQSLAYDYAARLMKFLQQQRPGKLWVLKSPHHLEFLNLADKHFKDVQFLWTHRNVHDAIPSFLSMVSYSRTLFSNEVDPGEVADHWVRKIGYMLDKAMEFRAQRAHESQFLDISYHDLVENSIEVMKNIYRSQNLEINTDLQQIFEITEQTNPKGKYGVHEYKLDDFKIERSFIDKYTSDYQEYQEKLKISRYGIDEG